MIQDTTTLPKLLAEKAKLYGRSKTALREKEFGIWQPVDWQEYYDRVKYFALGLASLGMGRDDKLAIIGDNRPAWIDSELAAPALGGVSVGLYQDSLSKEVAYIIGHSDSKFISVEDQEQVDKILEIKAESPEEFSRIIKVIYADPKGMTKYDDPLLISFAEIEAMGRDYEQENPGHFETEMEKGRIDDVAILCYTSGTTGFPKGAMLSHRNLLNMAERLFEIDPMRPEDEFVSFLPLAWIGEQMMSVSQSLLVGFTVNFPEEPETVQENLREIGAHSMFSPPRIWENMVSQVQVKIDDASWLKKALFNFFYPIGFRVADAKFEKKPVPLADRLLYTLGDFLIFSAIRDHLGLQRLRRAYTGGAALGPDVFRFFHALGVNLKQIYGQTEIAGISVVHRDEDIKFHSVGNPIGGTEVKISETGEILSKSASVFLGYYKNPEATAETVIDGWLHSGDAGYIDDNGHLVVIDRVKDVMRLADGTIFSPQFIENKLKFSQYIKEAVVIGKDRPYVVAMINIDFANTGKWAENNQIAYTTYTDLSQKGEVTKLIRAEVERVNKDLPEAARIKRFVLLHKELDADDEELTRTRKVRRGYVNEKYAEMIAALYGTGHDFRVEAKVRYRDGREAVIQTILRIVTM